MQRIAIIGSTGSGKSTLARALAERLAIPHTELDNLHWLPGWQELSDERFRPLVDVATSQPEWVIDGGYSVVRDLVWGRADTIIWLNYSPLRTTWQLLRRTVLRNVRGDLCCNGNRESLKRSLGPDSIMLWLLKSYGMNRRNFPAALARYPSATQLVFSTPKQTAKWLAAQSCKAR
jgi:energy-coupling factor transporter ATP-binding protein EcfA2